MIQLQCLKILEKDVLNILFILLEHIAILCYIVFRYLIERGFLMGKNYYKILQVDSEASLEVIEKAYKALAKKYHPDLQEEAQKAVASEKLKEINEAYEILSNPQTRAQFDSTLSNTQISKEDFDKIYMQNQQLQHELNNFKQNANSNNSQADYSTSSNLDTTAKNLAYQQELEYQSQLQAARERAYHDAYIQDLKNRGYKIKYKKTPKDIFKNIIALVLTVLIVFAICQLPFVKQFFVDMYEENELLQGIVGMFMSLF